MKRIPHCETQTNTFCEKDTLAIYQFIWISNSAFSNSAFSPNNPPGMSKVAPDGSLCLPFGVQITGALGAATGKPTHTGFHDVPDTCSCLIFPAAHTAALLSPVHTSIITQHTS